MGDGLFPRTWSATFFGFAVFSVLFEKRQRYHHTFAMLWTESGICACEVATRPTNISHIGSSINNSVAMLVPCLPGSSSVGTAWPGVTKSCQRIRCASPGLLLRVKNLPPRSQPVSRTAIRIGSLISHGSAFRINFLKKLLILGNCWSSVSARALMRV